LCNVLGHHKHRGHGSVPLLSLFVSNLYRRGL
jgi:hypothetical protein